jgi:hypothetical protein
VQRGEAARPSRFVITDELRDAREPPFGAARPLGKGPQGGAQIRLICVVGFDVDILVPLRSLRGPAFLVYLLRLHMRFPARSG